MAPTHFSYKVSSNTLDKVMAEPDPSQSVDWYESFVANAGVTLPPTATAALTAKDGNKHVYRLHLDRIEGLPVPPSLGEAYLNSHGGLQVQTRVSLFDMESGAFFGKTWVSPYTVNLRDRVDRKVSVADRKTSVSSRKASVSSRKASVSSRKASIKESPNRRLSKVAEQDEEEEEEEEETWDRTYDDTGSESQEDDEEEEDSQENESEEDEEDSEDDSVDIPQDANFQRMGQKYNVSLDHMNLFLQTTLVSPYIIAVVEYVYLVDADAMVVRQADANESGLIEVSAGWSYFTLFNPKRGGIDLDLLMEERDMGKRTRRDVMKTTQLYLGSPRILPFIAAALASGLPSPYLQVIPGAGLSFAFSLQHDLRSSMFLWKENTWIGTGDIVPGMLIHPNGLLETKISYVAVLSELRIAVHPSISTFEKGLLERIAIAQYESEPLSMKPDAQGLLPLPTITERRLHIGFHNSYTMIHEPIVASIHPFVDEDGHGDTYVFGGILELPRYFAGEAGIAAVFSIEFKVLIPVLAPKKKKNALSTLLGDNADPEIPKQTVVEKVFSVGWAIWEPKQPDFSQLNYVPVRFAPGPNPFSTLVYGQVDLSLEADNEPPSDGYFPDKRQPLILTFCFNDEDHPLILSGRNSPVIANIPSPVREEPKAPIMQPVQEQVEDVYEPEPAKPAEPQIIPEPEEIHDEREMVPVKKSTDHDASHFPPPEKPKQRMLLSRSERGRLLAAGFPALLDSTGSRPPVVQLGLLELEAMKIGYELESKDSLRTNEINLGFMGVTLNQNIQTQLGGAWPNSVFFTFQFYNFPYTSTEHLSVYTGELPVPDALVHGHARASSVPVNKHQRQWSNQSRASEAQGAPSADGNVIWPGIFYRFEADGTVAYKSAPGLSVSYTVDTDLDIAPKITASKYVGTPFVHYLSHKHAYIDVWDGESLMYLGTAAVELKPVLRQGRPSVTLEGDFDIVYEDYQDDAIPGTIHRTVQPTMGSVDPVAQSVVIGKLHMRISNIGRASTQDPFPSPHYAFTNEARKPYAQDTIVLYDYHQRAKHHDLVETVPRRVPEVDVELQEILSKAYRERIKTKALAEGKDADAELQHLVEMQRKLDIVANAKKERLGGLIGIPQIPGAPDSRNALGYQLTRTERNRDLSTIELFRERHKKTNIENVLKREITTTHSIYASFGQAYYLEFQLTNPYTYDHNFTIDWNDNELRLVTNAAEWKYLRRVYAIRSSVEDKLIRVRPDGIAEIYLLPNETVAIPFVFQSWLGGNVLNGADIPGSEQLPVTAKTGGLTEPGVHARNIQVAFLNTNKVPIALLDVHIKPRSYFVDRVVRFFRPEHDTLRKILRVPLPANPVSKFLEDATSTVYDTAHPSRRYLRCNYDDVACSLSDGTKGPVNCRELVFKTRVGPASESRAIHFLFYHDPFCTSLAEIWRVFVHSLNRVDINCVLGQTNPSTLVVRGSPFTRTVQCHTNKIEELLVMHPGSFTLTANALNEIGLLLRPRSLCTKEMILNIVDVAQKSLVSSWLVVAHSVAPLVTKSFEINIPKGKTVNKRVTYTNPFPQSKIFHLKSNHPTLLQFKESVIGFEPGATQYIGLRFLPCSVLAATEIMVFINDEADKIEECLNIKVHYTE